MMLERWPTSAAAPAEPVSSRSGEAPVPSTAPDEAASGAHPRPFVAIRGATRELSVTQLTSRD